VNGHRERLTVAEAAKLLSITPEAIRQRIRRGTIDYEQTKDGKYFVYVTPTEGVENNVHNRVGSADLRDHIETLKHELEIRNEELRRKDHIIAALTERIPAIEASSEPRESSETVSEAADKGTPSPEQQEPSRRRSWLARFFFGP
jgi:hypothetical protein